jgi:hypothetical protein
MKCIGTSAHWQIGTLFRYLELAGLDRFSGAVAELIDVYTAGEVCKGNCSTLVYISEFRHFPSEEIIDLDCITAFIIFFKFQRYKRSCRIRERADRHLRLLLAGNSAFSLLCLGRKTDGEKYDLY